MKNVYPILIYYDPGDKVPYYVEVPDFDRGTQGTDFAEALEMAEDLVNELIVTYQDQNMEIPEPSGAEDLKPENGGMVSWVVADPDEYRRKTDHRAVRKNVSLPSWLNHAAEKAGLNFSAVLQEALKEALGISSKP